MIASSLRDGTGQHFCSPTLPELTRKRRAGPSMLNHNLFSGPDRTVIYHNLKSKVITLKFSVQGRGGRSHFFKLRLRSCSKSFNPGPVRVRQYFKFENPTPVQTPATIINQTLIYPCFYLRNNHTDSCHYRNWKVTPDPGPVFPKFLTPGPDPG